MYVHVYVSSSANFRQGVYIYYIYVCVYVCIYVCMYVCVCVCICKQLAPIYDGVYIYYTCVCVYE
jgi:hypothetical protein